MTQFFMARARENIRFPVRVHARAVGPEEEFLNEVVDEYFGSDTPCWLLTDASGRAEPLIDDVWEAQCMGRDVDDTDFVKAAFQLIDGAVEFVCWSAGDFRELPIVESKGEFIASLKSQTRSQPADLFLRFRPRVAGRLGTP